MPSRLTLRHAIALGLVQGPTEVLPVSSSAHTALLPRLAGWPEAELDAELRNALEVALHAGTAAALSIALRGELAQAIGCPSAGAWRETIGRGSSGGRGGRALVTATLALAPPALVGYLMERRLERRPSDTRALCAGLALGGAALALADLRPDTRTPAGTRPGTRKLADAGPSDGLAFGVAQALALLPGVSRNGATLTAARARGFARADAQTLSWRAGLPVIAGAAALKAWRLAQRGAPPAATPALAAGGAAAFLSTLASAPLIRPDRRGRALWPFALYRGGLALLAGRHR